MHEAGMQVNPEGYIHDRWSYSPVKVSEHVTGDFSSVFVFRLLSLSLAQSTGMAVSRSLADWFQSLALPTRFHVLETVFVEQISTFKQTLRPSPDDKRKQNVILFMRYHYHHTSSTIVNRTPI